MPKGMDTFDARNHLDKDDPGMPQFLRKLNENKKKKKKEMPAKPDKTMSTLQDFVK